MLKERGALPSGSGQREIEMHGRQRQLTWNSNKKNIISSVSLIVLYSQVPNKRPLPAY